MYQILYDFFEKSLYFIGAVVAAFLACTVIGYILMKSVSKFLISTKPEWGVIIKSGGVYPKIAALIFPVTLLLLGQIFPQDSQNIVLRLSYLILIILLLSSMRALTGTIDGIYRLYPVSKTHPIKGYLQVVTIVVYVVGVTVGIAVLAGKSPFVLLTGLGAMTAVLTLIFKDSILGLVAGIQLTSNNMIQIGDWIEMPKHSADGTVVDLSLTTVKIQNFDQSITSLPAYSLVSDAFINWRNMELTGARRIKRSIYINPTDIAAYSEELRDRLENSETFGRYLRGKEISTNIGAFRVYACEYLKNHRGIHKEQFAIVRQLEGGELGIPLQVYAFTNSIATEMYESIQSDIFEHLYSVVGAFGLSAYQKPSGRDISGRSRV
ncbi:miniconductance mechanosensitive channel [Clostridia bacterium]|nr:miniconductance mechanosensitive channel [Clostridia bacterium]